jgi:CO/xanthine dehydrogenase Mo-binding subunit
MTTVERPRYKVVGTRPIRPDGVEKVTGKAQYGADIRLPGLIHGALLRSPHAHARIVSVDTRAAAAVPGVFAVMTAADIPAPKTPMGLMGVMPANVPSSRSRHSLPRRS